MASPRRSDPILFVAVGVFAFVAWFAYPPAADDPEEGRLLAHIEWIGGSAGDARARDFRITEDYTRIALSYNITIGYHVRANLTAPGGAVHEARPVAGSGDEDDRLDLEVPTPPQGRWRFTVHLLDEPGRHGSLERGNFTILGFGGPRAA